MTLEEHNTATREFIAECDALLERIQAANDAFDAEMRYLDTRKAVGEAIQIAAHQRVPDYSGPVGYTVSRERRAA